MGADVVGYITLLADCIILETPEKKKLLNQLLHRHQALYHFPALKIGRLAVRASHQKSGIGRILLEYAIGVVVRMNADLNVGCRFITVDAYPASVPWYEKNGFESNKWYAKREKTNSMRFDILKGELA